MITGVPGAATAIDSKQTGAHPPLGNFEKSLYERELLLAREIRAATSRIDAPKFLRIEQRNPGLWIVHVPLYTDIDDREFVQRFATEVERVWHLYSGGNEFRVELGVSFIPTRSLYNNRGKTHFPSPGGEIDLERHLAMFPGNGAILTTGAITTHVRGRAIILGPHALSGAVLAHEFGHILGFKDSYFRGYKDLGQDGFQIMEIDADSDDIMGRADSGAALSKHFDALLSSGPALETKLATGSTDISESSRVSASNASRAKWQPPWPASRTITGASARTGAMSSVRWSARWLATSARR
jgi:hypothetical protein